MATHYPEAAVTPAGRAVMLSVPSAALAEVGFFELPPTLKIRVPALSPLHQGEARLLAEVHLHIGDEHHFFFEPYAPVRAALGQDAAATDVVILNAAQLLPTGSVRTREVHVTVRPVLLTGDVQLSAQAVPEGFVLEEVVTGLNQGVVFDFAPDGRLFIGEKGGLVRVFEGGELRKKPFIDLRGEVNAYHDRGLLGLAVHPAFPEEPYVYLLFTYDPPEVRGESGYGGPDGEGARVARLVRVAADASEGYNVAQAGSEVVLLGENSTYVNIGNSSARNSGAPSCGPVGAYVRDCLPIDEWSHTVGAVRFGMDGSLFVSNGDGASYARVQPYAVRALDPDSLAGKLLRINPVTGRGYSDNPFFDGDPDSNRSKVYSLGLRNPFRFTVHPDTNEPFIGDVGWNTWEEVNTGRGQNFGWPCFEGGDQKRLQQGSYRSLTRCQEFYRSGQHVSPAVYAYLHVGGNSVQVGDFYTGARYPARYRGALFVSDFNQGWIRALTLNAAGGVTSVSNFATEKGVVQMSAGPKGDLYLMNIYQGKLKRLRYTAPKSALLEAKIAAQPSEGAAPLSVAFRGEGGGGTLAYAWSFGDGATSTEANPSHTYEVPGVYRATLRVTDSTGETTGTSLTVRVNNTPPRAAILAPADGARYTIGDTLTFRGTGTDAEEGTLPEEALRWHLKLHHNDHVHVGLPGATGETGRLVAEDHGDNTSLELCLRVRDSFEEDERCVSLYPNTVRYTLATQPSGLVLPWEGRLRKTPFNVIAPVGAQRQLIAPGQRRYVFVRWSDGGAREHTVTVGSAPKKLVASYRKDGRLELTSVCNGRWRVLNRSENRTHFSWKVTRPQRTGFGTVPAYGETSFTSPPGKSLSFYVDGRYHSTGRPSPRACK